MRLFKLVITFIVILLVCAAQGQVTADFQANVTEGCGSIQVQFINNSNGTGTLEYLWTFGNGNTSTQQNPVATYSQPGQYTVSLEVTNGTDTDVKEINNYIVVHANPQSNFESVSDLQGCSPLVVDFTDLTVLGDGSITSYIWSFGDGAAPGTTQNTTHTYVTSGIFDVSLMVTDAFGCTSYFEQSAYVTVEDKPDAEIIASQTSSCYPPLDVDFTNASTGTSTLSYEWDLGNGETSTDINTSTTYDAIGVYSVSLVATDQNQCTDTAWLDIAVSEVHADFSVGVNDTVCPDMSYQFENTSLGGLTAVWNFGDFTAQSTSWEPNHTYTDPGEYNVSLIVYSDSNCVDTIEKIVVVQEVQAQFSMSQDVGCEVPLDINLTDESMNAASYSWNFGDGYTSDEQNPTHTYTDEGDYSILLIVESIYGCSTFSSQNLTIQFPDVDFSIDTTWEGCGREISFTDNSNSYDSIVFWEWSFDDDDPENVSNDQNPTNTFTYNDYIHQNQGSCWVDLTITTETGCTASDSAEVLVGIKPIPQFFMFSDPDEEPYYDTIFHSCPFGCATDDEEDPCPYGCGINTFITCAWPDTMYFYDSSYVYFNGSYYDRDSLIDEWYWDFGEPAGSSSEEDPMYSYLTADTVGYMDVELIVGYNQCYDTLKTDSLIHVLGPIIKNITPVMDCDSPYVYTFNVDLVSATHLYWQVGDTLALDSIVFANDTTLMVDSTITHTFDTTGDYMFYVWAYNDSTCCFPENYWYYNDPAFPDTIMHKDSCMYFDSLLVQVRDIQADIHADTIVCAEELIWFDASQSQDAVQYSWDFGDGGGSTFPVDDHAFQHHDNTYNEYEVTLTVTDLNQCAHDTSVTIDVYKPFVSFTNDSVNRCVPFDVNFSGSAMSDLIIDQWDWNFGNTGSSSEQNPEYTFTDNGQFYVMLIATDTLGCSDTLLKPGLIITSQPQPNFWLSDSTLCLGDTVYFYDSSSATLPNSHLNYYWNFGDGDSIADHEPFHVYQDTGFFSVNLNIAEDFGCEVDTTKDYIIYVQRPYAGFAADTTYTDCAPLYVSFYSLDSTGYISEWTWNFGENDNISHLPDEAFYEYSEPGSYMPYLQIETSFGCRDTFMIEDSILIGGPVASFESSPDSICIGDTVNFNLVDTASVLHYNWDFGDGTGGQDSPAFHAYDQTGWITTNLWAYSDNELTCFTIAEDSVFVYEVEAIFTRGPEDEDTVGCEPLGDVQFINMSQGTDLTYYWNFADGNSSDEESPVHAFNESGTYQVVLSILDQEFGCND